MSRTWEYGATGSRPGTKTKYTTGDGAAELSGFGGVAHAGAYPKGAVRDANGVQRVLGPLTREMAERQLGVKDLFGGFVTDIQACLAADHFFAKGAGAGAFYAMRVTDGNERAASIALYDRDVDTSYAVSRAASKLVSKVATISAANGGRWGGMAMVYGGKVSSVSGAISGSDWATAIAAADWPFEKNELVGMTFALYGETRTWTVEANDATGGITVEGDFVGVTTTDGRWYVRATNVDSDGAPRGLAIMVRDGTQDPDNQFRLAVLENRRELRCDFDNVEMNPAGADYFEAIVQQSLEASQYEVTATDADSGVDPTRDEKKPANFAEIAIPGQVTARTVKFRILNFQITGSGDGAVGSLTNGGSMVPHKYVLTVKAGAAACTVAAYDITGMRLLASNLGDLTIATPYAAPHPFLSGLNVTQGTTPFAEGDVIEVYVRPLPVSAGGTGLLPKLGAWFYPHAFGSTGTGSKDVTTKYRVYSNTYDTITLGPNDDVTAVVIPPALPTLTGATTWDTTKDTSGKTFIFQLQGASPVTLTMMGGASQTCAQAAAELNLIAGGLNKVTFAPVISGGHTYLKVTTADAKYGPAYNLKVTTGTLNAVAGFTDNTTVTGAAPTVGRLEFYQDLETGRDGVADIVAATHFGALWDAQTSPLLTLRNASVGCLEMAQPGVTDVTSQQAGMDFAEMVGWLFRVEIPSTTTDISGAAARKWLRDNLTPNSFFRVMFPSYGYLAANPTGARTRYLCTLTGARQGVRAAYAQKWQGPHKAAADVGALLSPLFSSLPTDRTNGEAVELGEDLLNDFGIEIARHVGPAIYCWGDRIPGENWKWEWSHKVECYLHIVHELLANGDPLVFQPLGGALGKATRFAALALARKVMQPKFDAGWFKGATFEEAVDLKADDTNNPPAVEAAGRIVCGISTTMVDTAEKVEFNVGEKGVNVG